MAPPVERTLAANGISLHCRDWGGSGQPLVLLHGLASNARIWDFVAPRLTAHARVVALDQRGHGRSDRPDDGYTFDDVTADLRGAVAALELDGPIVVGHSWGANVAVAFAARHPQLTPAIVLVDGGLFDIGDMPWEEAERLMAPPRFAGTPRERFLSFFHQSDLATLWSPEMEQVVMGNVEVSSDDTVAPRLTFERHMKIVRAIWEYRPARLLPEIEQRVLILTALKDAMSEQSQRKRAAVERIAPLLKHARAVSLEGAIHDVPLQDPDRVASEIIAFLTESAALED